MSGFGVVSGVDRVWPQGIYDVTEFGAKPRSDFDSTDYIDDAWLHCRDDLNNLAGGFTNAVLYFPPGQYQYNGVGLALAANDQRICVLGAGADATTILIGTGARFINDSHRLGGLNVYGINFEGSGLDIIRFTYTGTAVSGLKRVWGCRFYGYTGCAIQNNSSDEPFWQIVGNQFQAADLVSSMGIALSGDTSGCIIAHNSFNHNRVHVKMGGQAGLAAKLIENDFVQFGTSATQRASVWIVPAADPNVNPGFGFICRGNKFGGENIQASDKPILFADEGSGADNGTRFPDLDTSSTGWVVGHTYEQNVFGNGDGGDGVPTIPQIVYSTTPNVSGCQFGPNSVAGTMFTDVLGFKDALAASIYNQSNVIYPPGHYYSGITTVPVAPSDGLDAGSWVDPTGQYNGSPAIHEGFPGGASSSGFLDLLTTRARSMTGGGATKQADLTDYNGGTDAAEWSFDGAGAEVYASLVAPTVGVPTWVEFSLQKAVTNPLTEVTAWIGYGGGAHHLQRVVALPTSGWQRYRFQWVPREATTTIYLVFTSPVTGRFRLSRAAVYQAREPAVLDGPVVMSPDGTKYRLVVSDAGALTATAV